MKTIDIEFKANYQGCDYSTKILMKCSTPEDLATARDAVLCFIDNRIAEMKIDEKAKPE